MFTCQALRCRTSHLLIRLVLQGSNLQANVFRRGVAVRLEDPMGRLWDGCASGPRGVPSLGIGGSSD
jgi:hypothetical protein